MKRLNSFDWIALVLVIVGAINWGLVGLADFNLVTEIFGDAGSVTQIVYALVGLSGLYIAAISGGLKKG